MERCGITRAMGGDGLHEGEIVRVVPHLHTNYSWDSRTEPRDLIAALERHRVDVAIVSDHDSFDGSLEAASLTDQVLIPPAAEIRTDLGDVIVIYEPGVIPPPVAELKAFDDLVSVAASTDALVWLPHPYVAHRDIERLAAAAAVIETFNARCSNHQNERAHELCRRYAKVEGFGADAHVLSEVGRTWAEYRPNESIQAMLLAGPVSTHQVKARRGDMARAERLYSRRRKRMVPYAWHSARVALASVGEKLSGS
ncbi:MAG: PHP domain-containing protein [Acidimicrobiia bacterium]